MMRIKNLPHGRGSSQRCIPENSPFLPLLQSFNPPRLLLPLSSPLSPTRKSFSLHSLQAPFPSSLSPSFHTSLPSPSFLFPYLPFSHPWAHMTSLAPNVRGALSRYVVNVVKDQ